MNSDNRNSCVQYFKKREGFQRAFLEMKKKWKRQGKIAGKIKISNATEEEKKEIGGFLGKIYWDTDIEFKFVTFEEALGRTKFAEVSLLELLEGYFEEKMISNQEYKESEEMRKELFWKEIEQWIRGNNSKENDFKEAAQWLQKLHTEKNASYYNVMNLWKKDEEEAMVLLKRVCQAISVITSLEGEGMPLAVLAAKVSGNPHFFDRGQKASQFLIYAVCELTGLELPRNAEEIQGMYQSVGIDMDELSSTVVVYGLHMIKNGKVYTPLEAMEALGESMVLSMANLRDADRIYTQGEIVLAVENEMVYSHLLETCVKHQIPFICTSGQLSRAAQKVLKMLCEEGKIIYYSGDTDPEGLRIADGLWRKYPNQIRIWSMSEEDYLKSISEEEISAQRLEKLSSIENPVLVKTAEVMKKKARAGYQENILDELKNFSSKFILKSLYKPE